MSLNTETPEEILGAIPGNGKLVATLHTSMGDLVIDLFEQQAPITVANFVGLALGTKAWKDPVTGDLRTGVPFYDGVIFHRIIKNFMIQGGDRLGKGIGGPGYKFRDEFSPELRHDRPGILSMANAGPGTNGSQFFITEVPTPHLNGRHSVFGLARNADLVKEIANVRTGAQDRPVEPVVINSITVTREG